MMGRNLLHGPMPRESSAPILGAGRSSSATRAGTEGEVEVVCCLAFFLSQRGEMEVGKRAEKGNSLNTLQGEAQGGKVLFKLEDTVGTRINRCKLGINIQGRKLRQRILGKCF